MSAHLRSQPISVRAVLIAAATGAVTLIWLMAALASFSVQRASAHLRDARNSYEQLAIINRLEAEFGRLLLAEMELLTRVGSPPELLRPSLQTIDPLFMRLLQLIEEEFERHPDDQDDRARELRNAEVMRTLFAQLHMRLGAPRVSPSDHEDAADAIRRFFVDTVHRDTGRIDRLVRSIAVDEANEVEQTLDAMRRLREWLGWGTPLLGLFAALGAALSMLLIHALVMRPVRVLHFGVGEFADGNLAHRIDVERPLEIADLARCCNAMAVRLAEQQERLTDANEGLERTVRERTRQLEESSERLRAIDASRRLFFGKVSHELRTPVTVLIGEAEVALRAPNADLASLRLALTHILATSDYLRRRLSDLIGLARSEDGRVHIQRVRFCLRDSLRDAVTVAEAYARSCGVRLTAEPGAEPAAVIGDASWIRQALLALIDNAVKFSPPDGEVRVRLRAGTCRHSLEIRDEGPGVDNIQLSRIFDPYWQTPGGRERDGTGLGLAIARWVSDQHAGEISASNHADGGLTVRIVLPAAAADLEMAGAPA